MINIRGRWALLHGISVGTIDCGLDVGLRQAAGGRRQGEGISAWIGFGPVFVMEDDDQTKRVTLAEFRIWKVRLCRGLGRVGRTGETRPI